MACPTNDSARTCVDGRISQCINGFKLSNDAMSCRACEAGKFCDGVIE